MGLLEILFSFVHMFWLHILNRDIDPVLFQHLLGFRHPLLINRLPELLDFDLLVRR